MAKLNNDQRRSGFRGGLSGHRAQFKSMKKDMLYFKYDKEGTQNLSVCKVRREVLKARKLQVLRWGNEGEQGCSNRDEREESVRMCEHDCFVYVRKLVDGFLIFLFLYVDDMLIAAKDMTEVNRLKTLLGKELNMKNLSVARRILGMENQRDISAGRL
ncbi:uncharacterized protein LOC131160923 [Malania oleifera]|uniref:uncharacterized protein LOC131160923 n=1 Tax=Malania oleifera TaxID=397392 RepID=UPI0025AE5F4E|nr:uncharacterized protein LOC131160923 [Malania oleifera]